MAILLNVPNSLAARTRKGLRRLMLLERAKHPGVLLEFKNFYYDAEKKEHVCWFMPITPPTFQEEMKEAEEVLNGSE